jgi:hypothetical protein
MHAAGPIGPIFGAGLAPETRHEGGQRQDRRQDRQAADWASLVVETRAVRTTTRLPVAEPGSGPRPGDDRGIRDQALCDPFLRIAEATSFSEALCREAVGGT